MCLCICYQASCYIHVLCCTSPKCSIIRFLIWHCKCMYCVDFAESALFVSFGSIADAKLLDFSPSNSSMTLLCINGILCTHTLYILWYYHQCMHEGCGSANSCYLCTSFIAMRRGFCAIVLDLNTLWMISKSCGLTPACPSALNMMLSDVTDINVLYSWINHNLIPKWLQLLVKTH